MAAIANWNVSKQVVIAETNSATIATDRTFSPTRFLQGGIALYEDKTGGIPLVFPWVTLFLRPPSKDNGNYRLSVKLGNPVAETIDPAVGIFGPRKAYELQAHIEIIINSRATAAERQQFLSQLATMFVATVKANDAAPSDSTGSPIVAAINSLESVY